MNRSIFIICEKFNFISFLTNFIFMLFFYLFGFFHLHFLVCDELIKAVINGITVRYSPSIDSSKLKQSVECFQHFMINNSNFKFSVFRYYEFNGDSFLTNNVYNHFHLNLYLDNMLNVHYGCPFTQHPENLNILPSEFSKFSDYNLYNKKTTQFILNNLYIYDLNLLIYKDYNYAFNKYIVDNEFCCIKQFKNIADIKK